MISRRHLARACALAAASLLAVPLAHAAAWTVLVRSSAGAPLADAVVAVEVKGQRPTATPGTKAQMAQRNPEFVPHILAVQSGTLVDFPNLDTVRHHVYSFSPAKTFDLKLYSGRQAEPQLFDKPGVIALGCNIHDNMSAFIIVVDTDLFALTDAKGEVHLQLPPGDHQLKVWQEGLPKPVMQVQPLHVDVAGGQSTITLTLE